MLERYSLVDTKLNKEVQKEFGNRVNITYR